MNKTEEKQEAQKSRSGSSNLATEGRSLGHAPEKQ